ncbi:hypothetical protein [Geothrix sp. 21YS21S-4]|uniref:hypothetical protein n=1 Tax=Geothrix sp. 21YS21S-4 TaxID=3068889 RepID=UPI0027BA9847|nr:hypothetical protein [Geothrix sp. 21YS21S-4]
MKSYPFRAFLLCAAAWALSAPASAQVWDAAGQAAGWAKQDKDDSFTFFDAKSRALHTWLRDGGVMTTVPLGKLEGEPARWVVDPRNNAWVASGAVLSLVDRTGRVVNTVKLPAEVGDVCWDARGFVLSYRTAEPYLERRDFKSADLIWAFGAKPPKRDGPIPANRRPVVADDAGNVLMADGNSLNLSLLDGGTGRKIAETALTAEGAPVPPLEGNAADREPLALWTGKGVLFAAVKATQVPAALRGPSPSAAQGLLLARIDLAQGRLAFQPTGLAEGHLLVGILESEAVFVSPKGGLMLVKIK